ncbi:MAG: cupin domain-containing protein [Gammaproteobacteria bacterium]|nr:cupin domain-containing protein [Gammaproteobacteria bacterium]
MTKSVVTHYAQIESFITKDGSIIRELMHPVAHGVAKQSLAEAIVAVGTRTLAHRHHRSEELYYILRGYGLMHLGDERFEVSPGDTVCIAPGTVHAIENIAAEDLVILCSCAPAYAHDDTEIL